MNKKLFVQVSAAFILMFGFYWLGKGSKSAISKVNPSISEEDTAASPATENILQKNSKTLISKNQAPAILANKSAAEFTNLKGAALYQELFDHKVFANPSSEDLQKVTSFFAKPYPQSLPQYQAEVVNRLGILKALEQQASLKRSPSSILSSTLSAFYKNVLGNENEHWLVKRQAFKNLKSSLSSSEREAWYSKLDSRVVALAANSESEILEEVLREKQSR